MNRKGRLTPGAATLALLASASAFSCVRPPAAFAAPLAPLPRADAPQGFAGAEIHKVVTFGRDSRRTVEQFAAQENLPAAELRRKFAASGLIECGGAHGAGQLTLTDDLVTTAAHVFFDEKGQPRAKSCVFVNEVDGREVRTPVDLASVVAGSRDPYAVAAVHDWAVARLTKPVVGVAPYGLAVGQAPGAPVDFVARGHIDWGEGRRLSMEKCGFRDQLSVGDEGTREFSFDCETGDGASGGAVIFSDKGEPLVGAVLVGWRSNKPFRSAPFSPTHYNFAVTIEGAFRKAVVASAAKVVVAR
ncbi:trypsin-like peptidase domain-containing protein [Methylocella sp.]|uniref:trypsin-like peptidase domain-containing protein n=1 Tax=Methylocella sp. TaxID=1978226 RepID=UPI00378489D7